MTSVRRRALGLALAATLAAGCATPRMPPAEVAETLERAVAAARGHHEIGDETEAADLLDAVLRIDSEHSAARALRAELSSDAEPVLRRSWLGSNVAHRPAEERPRGVRALLFLPDRLLDLADAVSFDVHLGTGLFADVHATRAVQAAAGFRSTNGIGWHDHRSLGALAQTESGLSVLFFGGQSVAAELAGTSGVRTTRDAIGGLHEPGARLYQELRDWFAVGAAVTVVWVGVEVDLHPVELVDFVLGWGGVDLLRDDLARTRQLRLTDQDRRLLRRLHEIERSRETLALYRTRRSR